MIQKDGTIDEEYGQELVLNLYMCDIARITSEESIREFVIKLCDEVIGMKRYGEALIPHFGHESPLTSGYSLVQLIETSSITAHFSDHKRSVYMNIFSCKWFDAKKTEEFCKQWFGAQEVTSTLILRP